jgi:hypothetical protein
MSKSVKYDGATPTVADASHLPSGDITTLAPAPSTSCDLTASPLAVAGDVGLVPLDTVALAVALGVGDADDGDGATHDANMSAASAIDTDLIQQLSRALVTREAFVRARSSARA